MLSRQQIKFISSLHQKKVRRAEKLFIAEGEKMAHDLLHSDWEPLLICVSDTISEKTRVLLSIEYKGELIHVSEEELNRISPLETPQGVLCVVRQKESMPDYEQMKHQLVLALDDVRDPGNLGTIIRLADWFGIEHVICSPNSAEAYNPKVVQASMGSLFRTSVHYSDLKMFLKKNETMMRLPVYGTSMDGENIYKAPLADKGIIILGNESAGMSGEYESFLTSSLLIPSFHDSKESGPDSLNVGIAAGIICSEFRRREL